MQVAHPLYGYVKVWQLAIDSTIATVGVACNGSQQNGKKKCYHRPSPPIATRGALFNAVT